jgi:hypothetical protein
MASKRPQPPAEEVHPPADDFKLINSISWKMESRIQRAGISSYAELAAMTPEEIAEQLGNPIGLKERIRRENWIAQAQELAALGKKTEPQALPNPARSSQRHETFAAELVLEADNQVSQTRLMHVPSGEEEQWDGWDERLLISFFINRAGLHFPTAAAPVELTLEAAAEPLPDTGVEAALAEDPPAIPPDDAKPEAINPERDLSEINLEILAGEPRVSSRILRHDQPFCVRLLLDWANRADRDNQPLIYTATIHTNKVGNSQGQTNYQRRGRLVAGKSAFLDVEGICLPPGAYRMTASVRIHQSEAGHWLTSDPAFQVKGGILQVY